MQDKLVSVIVRSSSKKRFNLLDQAIFSVLGSYYKNIEVVLVVQTQDDNFYNDVCNLASKYIHLGLSISIVRNTTSTDERAKNLNIGIVNANGRYIAFLDDDDVIYPDHILSLIDTLNKPNNPAWAYSDVAVATYDFDVDGNLYLLNKTNQFKQKHFSYPNLFIDNYIPIHSYILDRMRIDPEILVFDESMTALEDYAFLLKFAFKYKPEYVPKTTCEYRFFLDGSNTILVGFNSDQKLNTWEEARKVVNLIREDLLSSQIFHEYSCYKEVLKMYSRKEKKLESKTRISLSSRFVFLRMLKSKYPTLWYLLGYFAAKFGLIR
jgi:glycosyltransferase involved in cell wall biosynthesis